MVLSSLMPVPLGPRKRVHSWADAREAATQIERIAEANKCMCMAENPLAGTRRREGDRDYGNVGPAPGKETMRLPLDAVLFQLAI